MYIAKIEFKELFKVFIVFSIFYNGYRYFSPWDGGGYKPLSPFYISIVKDIPWAILTVFGLYVLLLKKESNRGEVYHAWKNFKSMTHFFIITHLVLLAVAIIHLFHKSLIDVLQRDIKNIQYILLPIFFPLLFKKEKDFASYFNLIVGSGVLASLFGFIVYFFIPSFTWEGNVLSTFQTPNNYGFFTAMLLLLVLPRMLLEKESSSYWYIIFCILFGALLTSVSVSAFLTFLTGMAFAILIVRPTSKILLRFSIYFLISGLLFFFLGLFNGYIEKVNRSFSSYKNFQVVYQGQPSKLPGGKTTVWELLNKPYEPTTANNYKILSQYTSIGGRITYLKEFIRYIKTADYNDILLGDFSLKNHFEYDNVYFSFIRNDGLIVTLLILSLLCSGFYIGFKKYLLFRKAGNIRMAGLSLGIISFLLTSIIIQFNLSCYLTIYPLNFITYFLVLLLGYMNSSDN